MRILLLMVAAALVGCGGKVESTAESSDGATYPAGACVYGSLGSVEGTVSVIASNGSDVYYATLIDSDHSSIGVLSPDQTTTTFLSNKDSWVTDLALYEDGVAAIVLNDVGSLGTRGTEIRFWNGAGTAQTVEAVDGVNGSIMNLTSNDGLDLVWSEYDTANGTSFKSWNEGPITTVAAPADFLAGEFLADGSSYFGLYSSATQQNLGQLAVNGNRELAFSSAATDGLSFDFLGLDSNNVYYAIAFAIDNAVGNKEVFSADRKTGQVVDLGAKTGVSGETAAIVSNGYLYSLSLTPGRPSIPPVSRYSLADGSTTSLGSSTALTATQLPGLITQDRCGIVYTIQDATSTQVIRVEP